MFLALPSVLSTAEAGTIAALAEDRLDFGDGKQTAGRFAREVKSNDQAAPSAERDAIFAKVEDALRAHPIFASAVRPRRFTPFILSRYREGQTYGSHVDDALMRGVRTDVSFTLFLSDPESYEGGALEIEDTFEARQVKLPAGGLVLYPSTTLHRVTSVTRGMRLAIVGWAESLIRSAEQREILFDLDRAVTSAHAESGASELFNTLAKTRSNLLRMWAET